MARKEPLRPPSQGRPNGPARPAAGAAAGAGTPAGERSAPSGRQVVVVRAGPPPRRRWADAAAGLLGLLVLLAAAGLAVTLPKVDELPPQFKVTFQEVQVDLPSQTFNFSEAPDALKRHEFLFNVTHDNVMQIIIGVHFTDDLRASDPDSFRIELYQPDGNPAGAVAVLANPVPLRNSTSPGTYDALPAVSTLTFSLLQIPPDAVLETDFNATAEGVAAQAEAEARFNTAGTWKLHVYLIEAGDCPSPGTAPRADDLLRGAACAHGNAAAGPEADEDPGNPFTVGSFSYRYFTVSAERLS